MKKRLWQLLSLLSILTLVIVIRQSWFELYEIPTGSMRPTFKEQDHLTVSKTQFGINTPLSTSHLYFDPALVERAGCVIFSGDGLALRDTETKFLGFIPYTKRYVKRLLALPKDRFTFYGGQIYLLNEQGEWVETVRTGPVMEPREYVPFLTFEGQVAKAPKDTLTFSYFGQTLARVRLSPLGKPYGEIFDGKNWVRDRLDGAKTTHATPETLSDLFGMGHYAMAQIYLPKELETDTQLKAFTHPEALLYLVLRHTPHLDFSAATPGSHLPFFLTSVLPLGKKEMETLMRHMYTSRFVVSKGKAARYSNEGALFDEGSVWLTGVPDGTYEFFSGKAYSVGFGGLTSLLPINHPLYLLSPERIQLLFNVGIQWDKAFQPSLQRNWPHRYAYFRDQQLYVLNAPLFKASDTPLETFIAQERKRQSQEAHYVAFIEKPAPSKESVAAFGLQVPAKEYLVLGDNHAMSGDSRVFGFVPEANLQGVPDWILWPVGDRMGRPDQPPYPLFVLPRLIIWLLAAIGYGTWKLYTKKYSTS